MPPATGQSRPSLSATHAFRIPVCIVSSSGEPVLAAGAGDRVVVMPAASTYDVDAAREERDNLEARIERNIAAIAALDAESERLSGDADALREFRTLYPEGWEAGGSGATGRRRDRGRGQGNQP